MTQQQFLEEIKQLSIVERITLIEAIFRSLRKDLESRQEDVLSDTSKSAQTKGQDSGENRVPVSQLLYGILKFDGDPPGDEELKDAYADYLLEKYS